MLNDYYKNFFSAGVNNSLGILQRAISSRKNICTFDRVGVDDISKAMQLYPFENSLDYNIFLTESKPLSNTQIDLNYHNFDENLFYEKLNHIQEELQKQISYDTSQYDIVKIIYDYITSHMDYDHDALKESCNVDMENKDEVKEYNSKYGECFTMYGPVTKNKGVCAGLCQLFKYLLNMYGVEAVSIVGYFKRNNEVTTQGHSVVLVEIDGECAFVDIASGMRNGSKLNVTFYDYFLVSEEKIREVFEPMFDDYQFTTTENLSYFYQNNLIFKNVNEICSFLNKIIIYKKENVVYFDYIGEVASKKHLEKIVNDIVSSKKGYQYNYDFVERKGCITLKIYQEKRGS